MTTRRVSAVRWGLAAAILAGLVALPAVVVSHTDADGLLDRVGLDGVNFSGPGGTRIVSRYPGGSFSVKLSGKVDFNGR